MARSRSVAQSENVSARIHVARIHNPTNLTGEIHHGIAEFDQVSLRNSAYRSGSGGNDYRLVVKINYPYRVVYVRFVGTHVEYDAIDIEEV
jgi:mRNA-degrading endonuclease HigB of HigAB toxin-antitoxin module